MATESDDGRESDSERAHLVPGGYETMPKTTSGSHNDILGFQLAICLTNGKSNTIMSAFTAIGIASGATTLMGIFNAFGLGCM